RLQHLAGTKIAECDASFEDAAGAGKQRLGHHRARHQRKRAVWQQMSRPPAEPRRRAIGRREERKPREVVRMTEAEEEGGVDGLLIERIAEEPQPGAGVEYEETVAAANLDARRVAAISRRAGAWAGSAAAHAPEAHRNISHQASLAGLAVPVG